MEVSENVPAQGNHDHREGNGVGDEDDDDLLMPADEIDADCFLYLLVGAKLLKQIA